MMHPDTELRKVNPTIGYGVFATADIAKGSLVYVKDALERVVTPAEYAMLSPPMQAITEKYSFVDPNGDRILSWDIAKYVNHRCDCNTMSTGWGFEIALRDIAAGEEITDEYGLFNLGYEMPLYCGCSGCRGWLRPDDLSRFGDTWDAQVRDALASFNSAPQPLLEFMDIEVREDLLAYLAGRGEYRSVHLLATTMPPVAGHAVNPQMPA